MKSEREFPAFKGNLFQLIGPSLVTLGLGIGSGEFVLWPFLASQYGFGIMWAAVIGITFQAILLLEISRYSVVTGESIVHGFRKVHRLLPFWLLISTIIGFGWPGFAATAAYLFSSLFGISSENKVFVSIILLLICGLALLVGKSTYKRIESLQKVILPLSFLFLTFLFLFYFRWDTFQALLLGLLGQGNGYNWLPSGIDMAVLLGAFAYAGSGGNFLLGQSFYVIERKLGNTKHSDTLDIDNDIVKEREDFSLKKHSISSSLASIRNFRKLRFFQFLETGLVFWGIGLLTILMLVYIAFVTVNSIPGLPKGFDFLLREADVIRSGVGILAMIIFVFVGIFALLSVQLGALDIMGRLAAWTAHAERKDSGKQKWHISRVYKLAVFAQLVAGMSIFSMGFAEPQSLIVTGAVFNALAMAVIAFVVLRINSTQLPEGYRPSIFTRLFLFIAGLSYIVLFGVTVFGGLF